MLTIRFATFAVLASGLAAAGPASGGAAVDDLLKMAPPDAAVTLTVEDLAGNARAFLDSPLAAGLEKLPAVRAWRESDGARKFRRSRREIEAALDVDASRIRDDLLGQAVVLALVPSPGEPPDRARGLLLSKVRDRDLMLRLVREINEADRKNDTLVDVADRDRGGVAYSVRTFRAGSKPTEYYALVGDVFAWSNSESLIQGAIDRRGPGGGAGLADQPRFRSARRGLPETAAAGLFVDPRFLERAIEADDRPRKPEDERGRALILRWLSAVDYAGAALQWRDGLVLHVHQAIDPSKVGEPLRRWAARPDPPAPMRKAPASALALAIGQVDVTAAFDLATGLIPESDRPKFDHVLAVLRGMLLGRDVRTEVLPELGPKVLAYVDTPSGPEGRWPWVAAVDVASDDVAKALENGLRTALSIHALSPNAKTPPPRVATRAEGGSRVTWLEGTRFAYAVPGGQAVGGSSPEAVSSYLSDRSRDASPGTAFDRVRSSYFPEASSFAFADLAATYRVADARRDRIARNLSSRRGRRPADARRDLDQALDLLKLFRAAFATSSLDPGFSSVHHTIGLIASEPSR